MDNNIGTSNVQTVYAKADYSVRPTIGLMTAAAGLVAAIDSRSLVGSNGQSPLDESSSISSPDQSMSPNQSIDQSDVDSELNDNGRSRVCVCVCGVACVRV